MSLRPQQIAQFRRDGYLLIDSGLDDATLTAAVADAARFWGDGERPGGVPYADHNRVQDAWRVSASIRTIATDAAILATLNALYRRQPLPFQTLNFRRGTQQKVHADTIHFNSEPFGLMCGVWLALEDIDIRQGPLVYYPGSHRLPEMNFEDFGLAPDYRCYGEYETRIAALIEQRALTPAYGTVKKGQAIIWSANLLHGGSAQRDADASRYSQVTHYFFAGARCWRPGFSRRRRYYFEPAWIPHPGPGRRFALARRIGYALFNRTLNRPR